LLATSTATVVLFRHAIQHSLTLASGRRAIANHLAVPVDLTAYYTTPASGFARITQFPAWKTVPLGFQVFDHVPLQIDGMFSLWGSGNAKTGLVFPEQVRGIKVKTPVCEVVFRYEDGSSVTNQMLNGDDFLEWQVSNSQRFARPTGPNSKLAWIGGSYSPKKKNTPLRFCLTAIENPQPSLEATSIDLYSCKSKTAACILAMTAGQSGLMK
jgi:hypothetical protein